MTVPEPRKVDLKRWRRDIVRHLEDFPRQYAALRALSGGQLFLSLASAFDLPYNCT
jgi:hypothetical protein